jgi:uncharacterized membrane protein
MKATAAPGPPPPAFPPPRLPPSAYPRMALVLRVGLLASLALVFAALAVLVAQQPTASASASLPAPSTVALLNLAHLAHGLAAGNPLAFLTLGLLGLVATPLVRVASGLYYFRRSHERALVAVATTVLILLLLGLLLIGPTVR